MALMWDSNSDKHLVYLLVTLSVIDSANLLESNEAWLLAMMSATMMVDLLWIMIMMPSAMSMELRLAYYLE